MISEINSAPRTNTMLNTITVYQPTKGIVATSSAKTGASGFRMQRLSEFKKEFKLGSPTASKSQIERAYGEMQRENGGLRVSQFAGLLTSGKIGLEAASLNKDGNKIRATFFAYSDKQEEMKAQLEAMDAEELKRVLMLAQSMMAKHEEMTEETSSPIAANL